MKRLKGIMTMLLVVCMVAALFSGCSKDKDTDANKGSDAPDTITVLAPPISANFQAQIPDIQAAFTKKYPNLTLKIEPASWEDMQTKLDIQVNGGTPPDIAFMGGANSAIAKYLSTGMMLDISGAISKDILNDFDANALTYMKNGNGLYGLPLYMAIQTIGGNKQYLEEAGIDWKSIQKNGWTFDQFRELVKKGIKKEGNATRYGFVFACSGVTAKDLMLMLSMNAGMSADFDKNLKYAYTDPNFLKVLEFVRQLIDDGSMPKNSNTIDAGARWNLMLTGQTMITGKGMPVFENSAKKNNAKLEAKDASAVKGSVKLDYIQLPLPTLQGSPEVSGGGIDGYLTFKQGKEADPNHVQNVIKALYFLTSGEWAAKVNSDLFLAQITKTGRDAAKNITTNIDPDNLAMTSKLTAEVFEPRPDITPDLAAKSTKIMTEVMVPKFQALLAGEITPQQMYDAVKTAAVAAFGENGIRK
jgi:multiple sugar transport system substrate-binding protein